MSEKSSAAVLSEQFDHTRLKSDNVKNTVRSELAVTDDENAYPEASVNSYGYENDTEEGYGYLEDCEEGFLFCKKKRAQYPQRSRSVLEEDAFPEISLTDVEARKCLNRIGQVGTGLMYAFVQIDVDNRNLTNIEEITKFKYLSLINVSHNHLGLDALDVLRELQYVVVVQADHNNVDSLCLSPMPYLQSYALYSVHVMITNLSFNISDNNISYLTQVPNKNHNKNCCSEEIVCPKLSTLALSRNALDTVEQFVIVSNKLRILYLSYNKIDKLNGLDDLRNLSRLHLRSNQISNLDGFTDNLTNLSYLNLRDNRLSNVKELKKLACLKSLKTLVVSDNIFSKKSIRSKVLKLLPWLKRIDKGTPQLCVAEQEIRWHIGRDLRGQRHSTLKLSWDKARGFTIYYCIVSYRTVATFEILSSRYVTHKYDILIFEVYALFVVFSGSCYGNFAQKVSDEQAKIHVSNIIITAVELLFAVYKNVYMKYYIINYNIAIEIRVIIFTLNNSSKVFFEMSTIQRTIRMNDTIYLNSGRFHTDEFFLLGIHIASVIYYVCIILFIESTLGYSSHVLRNMPSYYVEGYLTLFVKLIRRLSTIIRLNPCIVSPFFQLDKCIVSHVPVFYYLGDTLLNTK
ncbi:hypothetical protein QTP88_009014 [Uroleucon formosanum]